jgi:hypothetical protein
MKIVKCYKCGSRMKEDKSRPTPKGFKFYVCEKCDILNEQKSFTIVKCEDKEEQ